MYDTASRKISPPSFVVTCTRKSRVVTRKFALSIHHLRNAPSLRFAASVVCFFIQPLFRCAADSRGRAEPNLIPKPRELASSPASLSGLALCDVGDGQSSAHVRRMGNVCFRVEASDWMVDSTTVQTPAWTDGMLRSALSSMASSLEDARSGKLAPPLPLPQTPNEAIASQMNEWSFDLYSVPYAELPRLAYAALIMHPALSHSKVDVEKLWRYVCEIARHYHPRPFHNFRHAVDVLLATSSLVRLIQRDHPEPFTDTTAVAALLVSALVHDTDHPGVMNTYLIATKHPIAQLQGTDTPKAVLENHHAAMALALLERPELDFLCQFEPQDRKRFTDFIHENVINTDVTTTMGAAKSFGGQSANNRRPSTTVLDFERAVRQSKSMDEEPDQGAGPSVAQVMCLIIKAADISNPARRLSVYERCASGHIPRRCASDAPRAAEPSSPSSDAAESWRRKSWQRSALPESEKAAADLLTSSVHACGAVRITCPHCLSAPCRWIDGVMTEFFVQGDCERQQGLPISMNCDRETVVLAKAQVSPTRARSRAHTRAKTSSGCVAFGKMSRSYTRRRPLCELPRVLRLRVVCALRVFAARRLASSPSLWGPSSKRSAPTHLRSSPSVTSSMPILRTSKRSPRRRLAMFDAMSRGFVWRSQQRTIAMWIARKRRSPGAHTRWYHQGTQTKAHSVCFGVLVHRVTYAPELGAACTSVRGHA